jgi:hypothetical protein
MERGRGEGWRKRCVGDCFGMRSFEFRVSIEQGI